MNRTPLREYIRSKQDTQAGLGSRVGITQGSISKMIRVGRNIFVTHKEDGGVALIEERLIAESGPEAPQ